MNKDCSRICREHAPLRAFLLGFSLIELMLTLALLTFTLTVAVPSFSQFMQKNQIITEQQKVQSLLAFTRMAAVTQAEHVVICRWDGANGCTGRSQRSTQIWSDGALVFVDKNRDRALDVGDDNVLKIVHFSGANQITWNRGETLVYEADGSVYGGSNGTFVIDNGGDRYTLVVSMTGRVRRTL